MRDRLSPDELHAGEQRAVADSGRAEDAALAPDQIAAAIDAREIGLADRGDGGGALGVVARLHAQEHLAAEGVQRGGGEDALGRAADAVVEVHATVGERWRDGGGDVAIRDEPQRCAGLAHGGDERVVPVALERHHDEFAHAFSERLGDADERLRNGIIERNLRHPASDGAHHIRPVGEFFRVKCGKVPHDVRAVRGRLARGHHGDAVRQAVGDV